jgi:hypothetical protein
VSLLFIINRSVEDRPTKEPEKAPRKSLTKQPAFGGPSSGRNLPLKKRKASSEDLSIHVRLSLLIYFIMPICVKVLQIVHHFPSVLANSSLYSLLVCSVWARGSLVVKALGYKPEHRGFEIRLGEILYLPKISGCMRPWGLLSL